MEQATRLTTACGPQELSSVESRTESGTRTPQADEVPPAE